MNGGGRPSIDGHREQSDNFILDGMDNNQTSENQLGFTPSPDAIQEFNLITSNAPAEFGNYAGGIINASIKSGTNSFHGDAWEFFRNDVLTSNQWENKFDGPGDELKPLLCVGIFSAPPSVARSSKQTLLLRRLPAAGVRSPNLQQLHHGV